MTFGSLFAGIGGFDLGFERSGMVCKWQVEIDRDAQRVLAHHWPDVPRFADVRECGRANLPAIDVICGGFPCQDLSVAGQRGGLKGARSGLFYEMARIVDELQPLIVCAENVPGLLTSDDGRDFRRICSTMADIGYFGAWRTLDTQFFGAPQRRRRVFLVFACVDLGEECAAEILALTESGDGHPAPRGQTGQGTAATLRSRSHGAGVNPPGRGGEDDNNLVVNTGQGYWKEAAESGTLGTESRAIHENNLVCYEADDYASGSFAETTKARTVTTSADRTRAAPIVTGSVSSKWAKGSGGPAGDECYNLIAHTLSSQGADASEDGTGRGTPLVPALRASGVGTERCGDSRGQDPLVFQTRIARNGRGQPKSIVDNLTSSEGGTHADSKPHIFSEEHGVRRLMPVECLRLQSFPDDWLDLDPPLSDSAKYRLIGNAVTVNVANWIGRRIMEAAHVR